MEGHRLHLTAALAAIPRAIFRAPVALALAAIAVLAPAAVQAQTASQPNANVVGSDSEVSVLRPLSITKLHDLDFGGNVATPAGGTVVLDPTGTDGCTATGVIHVGDICQAAEFGGGGQTSRIVRIKIPQDITITGPGADMLIDTMTLDTSPDLVRVNTNGDAGNNGTVRYRIVSPTGLFLFRMGGTLNVNPNQTPGEYTGTFEVRLDYQ